MSNNSANTENRPSPAGQLPLPKTGRGGLKGYIRDVQRELKKVEWPTPKETNRLTGVVLAVCGIVTVIIILFSLVADVLVRLIQGKL